MLIFAVPVTANCQTLTINEVQYSNQNTIQDTENDTPDWIEIFNADEETINLEGYQLTDNISKTDYWTFPEYQLRPDSFLLVFASAKNKIFGKDFHTDFKLRLMKDPVYLINPAGEIIDMVENQCVPPDRSIGRWPDISENVEILTPTPGFSNNKATRIEINFQSDTISVTHQSGFYQEPLSIEISNSHIQNQIYYTLNGEAPDARDHLYEDYILLKDINQNKNRFSNLGDSEFEPGDLISKANILRAIVLSEGCPASEEIINTYFINENSNIDYNFPVISLITEKDNLFDKEIGIYVDGYHNNYAQSGKEWERPVHLEIFDTEGFQIIDQNAGFRLHGSASRSAPQKSLRLYARDEYGKDSFEYPFFNQKPSLDRFKTLLLRSTRGWSGTLFKDELCQVLVQDMNIDYSATQTAIVFINGEYWGIYSLRERHDKDYIENNFGITNSEVDILDYNYEQVSVKEGTIDRYNELIDNLENHDVQSEDYYSYIDEKIDLSNLTDYFIAQFYLANADFPFNNVELWNLRNDTSKWRFFFFDLDGAMFLINQNHLSEYNNTYVESNKYPDHTTYLFRSILQNPEFRKRFSSHFTYHLKTTFSPNQVIDKINYYESLYSPIVSEHIYRWNKPVAYNKWIHNIETLRLFAIQRPPVIYDQLSDNFGNPFVFFPNPSKDFVNIEFFNVVENAEVKIYTANGRLVQCQNLVGSDRITLHPGLKSGVYILQVLVRHSIYTDKLIVQR